MFHYIHESVGSTYKFIDINAVKVYYILALNYTIARCINHNQSISNLRDSRKIQANQIITNPAVS